MVGHRGVITLLHASLSSGFNNMSICAYMFTSKIGKMKHLVILPAYKCQILPNGLKPPPNIVCLDKVSMFFRTILFPSEVYSDGEML